VGRALLLVRPLQGRGQQSFCSLQRSAHGWSVPARITWVSPPVNRRRWRATGRHRLSR